MASPPFDRSFGSPFKRSEDLQNAGCSYQPVFSINHRPPHIGVYSSTPLNAHEFHMVARPAVTTGAAAFICFSEYDETG
jgi:hypothetical protein